MLTYHSGKWSVTGDYKYILYSGVTKEPITEVSLETLANYVQVSVDPEFTRWITLPTGRKLQTAVAANIAKAIYYYERYPDHQELSEQSDTGYNYLKYYDSILRYYDMMVQSDYVEESLEYLQKIKNLIKNIKFINNIEGYQYLSWIRDSCNYVYYFLTYLWDSNLHTNEDLIEVLMVSLDNPLESYGDLVSEELVDIQFKYPEFLPYWIGDSDMIESISHRLGIR